MESVRAKLGFFGKLVVNAEGRKYGLCLFWTEEIDVSLLSYSKFHIDVQVRTQRLTGFYGHPEPAQRHHAWTLLRRLYGIYSLPWLCAGDFNEILEDTEKQGGIQRPR
ncbi:hypothetical protein Dsin_016643 [Dipteronia sinensis]|uniref:Endonuclease/exonuclease/phosphatase domain-containing protein n=1 Tax=Dipteronia sinensis TaxID=43782 RepID=A0AAE0AEU0_9ROSI|nr:hypothetical protein Dsin_016643 [Dipteronia sinensis]